MTNPTAAMITIGDEILSGRTQDTNMHHLAGELTRVGIDLRETRAISDDAEAIITAVNELRKRFDHVFTSGGIGPTHDDITAPCIAEAFGVNIAVRADARKILQDRYDEMGTELNAARLRMARIPDTATLIDNPVSGAPGFTIGNVHVLAGVPSVFHAMVASVLPTLTGGSPIQSQTRRLLLGEGEIAGPLADFAAEFPGLSIGSYPFQHEGVYGANIVVRGDDRAMIDRAMTRLHQIFPEGV